MTTSDEHDRRPYERLLAERRRHRRKITLGLGIAVVVVAAAVVGTTVAMTADGDSPTPPPGARSSSAAGAVTIGSADFAESVLLADIYGDAMAAHGVKVTKRLSIGERDAYLAALDAGQIGAVPEYSGSMLAHLDPQTTAKTPDDVYAELQALAADKGMAVTQFAEAEDSDTITVTARTASRYHLRSIDDLKPVAQTLTFGGPTQFRTRADGIPALQRVYGVRFGGFTVTDAGGRATVDALQSGAIDAGDIFSTDPAITTNGFVALEDPRSMFSANNVVPVFRSEILTPAMRQACDEVSARLDTATLAALVVRVVRDKLPSDQVAQEWLTQQHLM